MVSHQESEYTSLCLYQQLPGKEGVVLVKKSLLPQCKEGDHHGKGPHVKEPGVKGRRNPTRDSMYHAERLPCIMIRAKSCGHQSLGYNECNNCGAMSTESE